MPASNSFWNRLFAWLFGRNTSNAPGSSMTAPPPVPSTPVSSGSATNVPSSPVVSPLPVPTEPAPPEPASPPVAPLGDGPELPPPETPVSSTLPEDGVQLGFIRLWNNHPAIAEGDVFPCKDAEGTPNFGNQCGIMMGTCLLRSGLLAGYDKSVCWYAGHKGHTLRAREVADWMRRHPDRFGLVEVRSNVTWGAFKGRTGLVCFHNFWGEGNQGDHIDLWDGTGIVRRMVDPSLEGPGMAHGSLDYFERSEEVWFWPIH